MHPLISPQELRAAMLGKNPPTVLDVRGEDEYRAGHIAGARRAPREELEPYLAQIPKDRPVVPY